MDKTFEDKREIARNVFWNCIVITCSDPTWRDHIERELNHLAKAGLLPSYGLLLVVGDPQPSILSKTQSSSACGVGSGGVGSGGATLNALLHVAERLSALNGDTTINSDVLFKNQILIVHFGRRSYHYPGGNAFLPVNAATSWVPPSICSATQPSLLQSTIWMSSVLASQTSHGVWISSLDFFIPFCPSVAIPPTQRLDGALVCSLKLGNLLNKSDEYGFLSVSSDQGLQEIIYKTSTDENSRIICGLLFLSPCVAERMLSLYTLTPLDRCTYYGTDSASEPVQVSLYFDLLLPLCSDTNKEKYLCGELGATYARKAKYSELMRQERVRARHNIWNQLRSHSAFEHRMNIEASCCYLHPLGSFASTLERVMTYSPSGRNLSSRRHPNAATCNSRLDCHLVTPPDCRVTLLNCILGSSLTLEAEGDCVVSDIRLPDVHCVTLHLGKRVVWQRWPLDEENALVTCHGFDDPLAVDRRCAAFSLFGLSWEAFAARLKVRPGDVWEAEDGAQTLAKARLFPANLPLVEKMTTLRVLFTAAEDLGEEVRRRWTTAARVSLEDALRLCAAGRLFRGREDAFVALVERLVRDTARRPVGPLLIPSFKYATAISSEEALALLDCFHEVLLHYSPTSSRLLANVADLLGCLGGPQGGLRSGPAANGEWVSALAALKNDNYKSGIKQLENVCKKFIRSGRPDDIIRASRHYERASQILIGKQVDTTRKQVFPLGYLGARPEHLSKEVWVEASCPARLDLSGGWTDTPPVCYELGGAVLNVAIKVNGKRPIGSRARFTDALAVSCTLQDWSGAELKLVWEDLEDLRDYDNPVSAGAIVKACLVYAKFVELDNEAMSLQEQLENRYGGGLELVVWSKLRQGSGLGGSSLLVGVILAALFVLMGFEPPSATKLIHATLSIEQMLSTAGGWQDSVGGLVGGLKLGISRPGTPLVVDTFLVAVDEEFLRFLNQRLVLIYTGKVRLARNLLQTVLRNWYARESTVTTSFAELRALALEAARAALLKDGAALGSAIDRYWHLKKVVASGCEPSQVSDLMAALRPAMLGQSLAGAGGGGYAYGLAAEPDRIKRILLSTRLEDMEQDSVEVDLEGLRISVAGQVVMETGCEDLPTLTLQALNHIQKRFQEPETDSTFKGAN